ncbi:MAG: hypothetical protein R3D33_03475 [Hyphomicrobiaceae bacterium]
MTKDLNALIGRFPPGSREMIGRFCEKDVRYWQLCETAPIAIYALATAHGPSNARNTAALAVLEGAKLAQVLQVLGIPRGLRRLPPEIVDVALASLSTDGGWMTAITGHLPLHNPHAAREMLLRGKTHLRYASTEFAAWYCGQIAGLGGEDDGPEVARVLAVYAFISRLLEERCADEEGNGFSTGMEMRQLLMVARAWFRRQAAVIRLKECVIPDMWLKAGCCRGHQFRALDTWSRFVEEAEAMDNCVCDRMTNVALDEVRLFSVRDGDGRRVATVMIGPLGCNRALPAIREIRGPGNRPVSDRVYRATLAWIAGQRSYALPDGSSIPWPAATLRRWHRYWQPYWNHFGDDANPLLPRVPDPLVFRRVDGILAAAQADLRERR